jgi:hypothetical protein
MEAVRIEDTAGREFWCVPFAALCFDLSLPLVCFP